MRKALPVLALAVLMSALASAAAAAPRAPSAVAVSPWCAKATKYAMSAGSNSLKNTPKTLKGTYTLFKQNESSILSAAPGQIKSPLRQIFSYEDKFFAALAKANWNVAALDPTALQSFVADAQKILPAERAIIKYFNGHCGTHIAVP